MRNSLIILMITVICLFSANGYGAEPFLSQILRYEASAINLKEKYPEAYQSLYQKVKGSLSKQEFDALMSRKEGIELDDAHKEKLKFIASPQSVAMQKQQHKDWIPILVNDETLKKGQAFFKEYETSLRSAYGKTGVTPGDIIAVLNWESKLGERRGTYTVFKIFTSQYFYIAEIEKELFDSGEYEKKDAMPREKALKRIEKLKNRALSNLSDLLIQSKNKKMDPLAVKGSWAGAIGIPQFMPASMSFARDGDDDGEIDLNTVPDAIMSVASYLKLNTYHEKGKESAFKRYNPEDMYVRGVMLYSGKIEEMGVVPLEGWKYSD